MLAILATPNASVSIPYERESTSEQKEYNSLNPNIKFQFPTNGKVHLNEKKEETKKVVERGGFNSLRTGKYIWTDETNYYLQRNSF